MGNEIVKNSVSNYIKNHCNGINQCFFSRIIGRKIDCWVMHWHGSSGQYTFLYWSVVILSFSVMDFTTRRHMEASARATELKSQNSITRKFCYLSCLNFHALKTNKQTKNTTLNPRGPKLSQGQEENPGLLTRDLPLFLLHRVVQESAKTKKYW